MKPFESILNRPVTRRNLLAAIPAAAALVGVGACASSSSGGSSGSSASASASGATATATGTAKAGGVAALAQAFHKTLDSDQQSAVLLDYSLDKAKLWSNLPQALLGRGGPGGSTGARVGLSVGDLDDDQLAALNALLKAASGSGSGTGYDGLEQQLNADDYLAANGGGDAYGRANYYVAILGSPQDSGTWELQFGGHHLAVANTYTDGVLAGATPSFRGVEPNGEFQQNGRTNQPMKAKQDALAALLAGLSAAQLASAKLGDTYSDLVLGPGKDWAFPTDRQGVRLSGATAAQKKLALAAIASYVDDISDAEAAKILSRYESELDDTYVAYSGTTALTERNDYVRIDGPSVWVEFSMQNGIVLSGNHPHSVWRDRTTDYGGTKS
ncbi:DUF3500 domain-containing protein [Actinoplanes sp. URMC 104]|uniref:DUF3500 domain-containing protein n=1 Tax=Actinoplanes sp. URMC 104 TaxID=3423409 RepID=UPI003F1A2EFE